MTESRAPDHYRTLLEISNALIANLTRQELFHAIAQAIRRAVPFDRTAIFLHDPERDVLRLFVLESTLPSSYFAVGFEVAPMDSHIGEVFRRREPLVRRDLAAERRYPAEDSAYRDGVRSYAIVPLVARGRSIGALAVASTAPDRYGEAEVRLLAEVAIQVAVAVENMMAYERLQEEGALRARSERLLRTIAEGTASAIGAEFFRSLVRHLALALGTRYAFVSECSEGGARARTLAYWSGDGFVKDVEYDVGPTPCVTVLEGRVSHHASGVQALFPGDRDLVDLGVESYLGVPVTGASGRVLGHLAVLDDEPMPADLQATAVLTVFAARAGAEIERLRAEEDLRRAWAEVTSLKNRLQAENVYLQEEIGREHNFVEMVGSHPALLATLRKVEQVAPTESTVLISGETGTGKELIARAIHSRSGRAARPLVKVNCAAISAGLVESELFGHVKGAFTGAIERRVGRFELAHGGTLFLDEVGELPLETQVKLLRVLQEQEFEPVGSSKTVRVDVRVIAATNRDLEEAVRGGRFRADLFYRLNVLPLRVPALRERSSDIPQLVMFFLARFGQRAGKRLEAVSHETMERLVRYPWPGNVRELANVVERAAVLCEGAVVELEDDLSPRTRPASEPAAPFGEAGEAGRPVATREASDPAADPGVLPTLEEVERAHIVAALRSTGWVIEGPRGAAKLLGLHPNTLRSRMEKLGVKRPRHDMS